MWTVSVVAKLKTRQYVLKTDSPNLMLARYTIWDNSINNKLNLVHAIMLKANTGPKLNVAVS